MTEYKTDLLDLRRMDCMDLMAQYPDKHFDLAIDTVATTMYYGAKGKDYHEKK